MLGGILGIVFALIALWGAVFLPSFFTKTEVSVSVPPVSIEQGVRIEQSTSSVPSRPPAPQAPPKRSTAPAQKTGSQIGTLVPKDTTVSPVVTTPGPLRVSAGTQTTTPRTLSASGVLSFTNKARADNGALPPLVRNETLDRAAQIKLDDMFGRQYFDHVSPIGVGPADLAKIAGYAYIAVGENLALGNFASDEKLVDAWMNSPGHRANILNTHYREIGIAVGKGTYEGKETWLAVQSFGTPLSVCPTADAAVKAEIEGNNTEIARQKGVLDAKKAEIDGTSRYDPSYNKLVEEYNVLVPPYNELVEKTRTLVTSYNASVQAFNTCIAEEGGSGGGH